MTATFPDISNKVMLTPSILWSGGYAPVCLRPACWRLRSPVRRLMQLRYARRRRSMAAGLTIGTRQPLCVALARWSSRVTEQLSMVKASPLFRLIAKRKPDRRLDGAAMPDRDHVLAGVLGVDPLDRAANAVVRFQKTLPARRRVVDRREPVTADRNRLEAKNAARFKPCHSPRCCSANAGSCSRRSGLGNPADQIASAVWRRLMRAI